MNILMITMMIFACFEVLNVIILYGWPGSKKGNGLGMFTAWELSKKDESVHALIRYLVFWVAGTKLIFIGLLIVIILLGDEMVQLASVVVLLLTISTFFWRLYPMIRAMDRKDLIQPKGYSKILGTMIALFLLMFLIAIMITIFV